MVSAKNTWFAKLQKIFPILVVILLAAILRFLWLDRIPNGIAHDELTYILNVKSIAVTGRDLTGSWNPLSAFLFRYPPGDVQAELPYFLFLPLVGFLQLSLFTAHATNALLGVGTAVLVFLITEELFGKSAAFIAGILTAINPWLVYSSRTAYEVTPAIFFYLLGLYILFKTKQWKIFYALPLFILAFYSYIGTKLIFPFVIIAACAYLWFKNGKKYSKQYILFSLLSLVVVIGYFVLLKTNPSSSRMGEIFTPSDPQIVKQVDALRKTSVHTPVTNLYDNKISFFAETILQKLFKSFSFDYLFVYGDSFFTLWHHGLFYYLDALFLFVGLTAAWIRSKRAFLFLLILIAIGVLPQIAHSSNVDNFTPHIAFIFPFMIILIAVGIQSSIETIKTKLYRKAFVGLIVVAYVFLAGNFLNIYFFENPITSGYFGFQDRVLARYVQLASQERTHVFVYSHMPKTVIERYLFYTDMYHVPTQKMQAALTKGELTVGNVTISPCKNIDVKDNKNIIVEDYICEDGHSLPGHVTIPQLNDGGETYGIYNDNICSTYSLKQYPSNLTMKDFAVESLDSSLFCTTFITRP